jgi:DNA-binding NarL/FixJ family response regulator
MYDSGIMIRVLLADDHQHVRRGLKRMLQQTTNMEVIGEASDGQEAVELARLLRPDVVVMDITMPKLDGFQALAQIRQQGIPTHVVMLSMHADNDFMRTARKQGARGYVLKRDAAQELPRAIQAAWRGDTYFTPQLPYSPD